METLGLGITKEKMEIKALQWQEHKLSLVELEGGKEIDLDYIAENHSIDGEVALFFKGSYHIVEVNMEEGRVVSVKRCTKEEAIPYAMA